MVGTGRADAALAELAAALRGVDPAATERAAAAIAGARRVVLAGCGREGLMMRALAQRLFHLGLDVGVQGDVTCPPVGPGDLFFASSGPGRLATMAALMGVARGAGARVLLLTAEPEGPDAALADDLLVIPAQTMARDSGPAVSVLPMGSLFEGAMFLLFELMLLDLRDRLVVSPEAMRARHTNLE